MRHTYTQYKSYLTSAESARSKQKRKGEGMTRQREIMPDERSWGVDRKPTQRVDCPEQGLYNALGGVLP